MAARGLVLIGTALIVLIALWLWLPSKPADRAVGDRGGSTLPEAARAQHAGSSYRNELVQLLAVLEEYTRKGDRELALTMRKQIETQLRSEYPVLNEDLQWRAQTLFGRLKDRTLGRECADVRSARFALSLGRIAATEAMLSDVQSRRLFNVILALFKRGVPEEYHRPVNRDADSMLIRSHEDRIVSRLLRAVATYPARLSARPADVALILESAWTRKSPLVRNAVFLWLSKIDPGAALRGAPKLLETGTVPDDLESLQLAARLLTEEGRIADLVDLLERRPKLTIPILGAFVRGLPLDESIELLEILRRQARERETPVPEFNDGVVSAYAAWGGRYLTERGLTSLGDHVLRLAEAREHPQDGAVDHDLMAYMFCITAGCTQSLKVDEGNRDGLQVAPSVTERFREQILAEYGTKRRLGTNQFHAFAFLVPDAQTYLSLADRALDLPGAKGAMQDVLSGIYALDLRGTLDDVADRTEALKFIIDHSDRVRTYEAARSLFLVARELRAPELAPTIRKIREKAAAKSQVAAFQRLVAEADEVLARLGGSEPK